MQNIFLYKIHIHFPIDRKQLIITTQSLKDQNNLFELIFDIASLDDYLKAWEIIEEYQKGNQGSIFIGFIKSLDDELLLKLLQKIKDHFPHIDLHYKAYSRKELFNII